VRADDLEKLATFRFYASLNDFLDTPERGRHHVYAYKGNPSIKHALEALGVPHPEVDLLLVNGAPVDFSYLLKNSERVSVYPAFASIDVASVATLRPPPPNPPSFILDNHLGKLASHLRLLGFDTRYQNDFDDETLAHLSHQDRRILLTRDRGLLMRKIVTYGYWIREKDPRRQLIEILRRFDLRERVRPFRLCLRCNGLLHPIPKRAVMDRLEPKTRRYYHHFYRCAACHQIYWRGSHYEGMKIFIQSVLKEVQTG
jgi:uncharacterized protein with PIN domain